MPTETANPVKGWAAVLRECVLAMDCNSMVGARSSCLSSGAGDIWKLCQTFDTLTFPQFSPGKPNANTPHYAQACSLDVILHSNIDFNI